MKLVGAIKKGHITMKNLTGYKWVNKKLVPAENTKYVVIDIFNKCLSDCSLKKTIYDLNKRNSYGYIPMWKISLIMEYTVLILFIIKVKRWTYL